MKWCNVVRYIEREGPDQGYRQTNRSTCGRKRSCFVKAGYRKKLGLNTSDPFCVLLFITGLIFLP